MFKTVSHLEEPPGKWAFVDYHRTATPYVPGHGQGKETALVAQCRADGLNLRFTAATMPLRDTLAAAWKYCLSFRKTTWELSDYPVVIREQRMDLDLGLDLLRFEQQRYLARVVKWWVLNGGGNTPKEAMQDLAVHFEEMRSDRERAGKALPRPGAAVPIEFAPTQQVDANPELKDDFIRRVLGLEWAFISDGSSLWDFHTEPSLDAMHSRIKEIYGVDVAGIASGNIAQILSRIAAKRTR